MGCRLMKIAYVGCQFPGVYAEEVILQDPGYFQQQGGVNGLAFENFVSVRSVAAEFFCKPHSGPFLTMKFGFDHGANCNLTHLVKASYVYKKGRNSQCLSCCLRHRQAPLSSKQTLLVPALYGEVKR